MTRFGNVHKRLRRRLAKIEERLKTPMLGEALKKRALTGQLPQDQQLWALVLKFEKFAQGALESMPGPKPEI